MSAALSDCLSIVSEDASTADPHALCDRLLASFASGRLLHEEHGEEHEGAYATFENPEDWVNLAVTTLCVVSAAMAAGLTMGTVSLDPIDLRVKQRCGTDSEKRCAAILLPLIEHNPHHQLLVTLLLLNATAMEAMPIFLDKLVPEFAAVLISVTLILFFGEITPSAIFTGPNKLQIAAACTPFVRLLMLLAAPLAWPVGWALDRMLGEHESLPSRREVIALGEVQRDLASQHGQHGAHGHDAHDEGSALSEDELDLLRGALSLNEKHVESVMKPLSRVYSLMPDAVLDERTMGKIVASGFSRVPIRMAGGADTIAKYLIVKEQLMLSPADRKPATSVLLHAPVWVGPGSSLFELLNEFQTGSCHMAFVSHDPEASKRAIANDQPPSAKAGAIGLVTLEDIIEEILTEEIHDEADVTRAENVVRQTLRKIVRRAPPKRSPSLLPGWAKATLEDGSERASKRKFSERQPSSTELW